MYMYMHASTRGWPGVLILLKHPPIYLLPAQVSTAAGLQEDDDLGEFDVPLLLQLSQHSSSEEDLGVADAIGGWVQIESGQLRSDATTEERGREGGRGRGRGRGKRERGRGEEGERDGDREWKRERGRGREGERERGYIHVYNHTDERHVAVGEHVI